MHPYLEPKPGYESDGVIKVARKMLKLYAIDESLNGDISDYSDCEYGSCEACNEDNV